MKRFICLMVAALALGLSANFAAAAQEQHAVAPQDIPQYIQAAVNSPERSAADKQDDAGRRYDQLMAFYGVEPGMKTADLMAGAGITTEVLSLIVGPEGKVYSINPMGQKPRAAVWRARLPKLKNVVGLGAIFDPATQDAIKPGSLDFVILNLNYHDLVWMKADRAKINAWVFKILKPGGVYGIADSAAAPGSGARDVKTMHRIDPAFVTNEVTKAGFTLAATSDILHHPEDDYTKSQFQVPPGHVDRFVLKFVKPST